VHRSNWRTLLLASALLLSAPLVSGCAQTPTASRVGPPAQAEPGATHARLEPPGATPEPTLTTLYSDLWPGLDAVLLGVDQASHRAYLKLRVRGEAQRYAIDTIDFGTGERIERWEAAPDRAARLATYDAHFAPFSSDRSADFERLGGMMSRWRTRWRHEGSHWPIDDVSPNGTQQIYSERPTNGRDGDWLYLRQSGRRPVRIDRGVIASYDAKFSPDGRHIAWQGCTRAGARRRARRQPCRYHLYISRTRDAARGRLPQRVRKLTRPSGPVWSRNGSSLFVLSQPNDAPPCVRRVSVDGKREHRAIACGRGLKSFALDPRATKLVHAARRDEGRVALSLLSLDQPDDVLLREVHGSGEVSLSRTGLVLTDHVDGLLAIDMTSGRRRLLPSDEGFIYVPTTHWLDDHRALMLRKSFSDGTVALVMLDVSRFLEEG
jgi:hypothetical protein